MLDAPTVTNLTGALVLLIGAIASATVLIIKQVQANRDAVTDQNPQLNRIEVLVNGRYSEVLNELADIQELMANLTNHPDDIKRAKIGRAKATEQSDRIKVIKGMEHAPSIL